MPSYNTIGIWAKKCGLKVYEDGGAPLKDTDYAEIVDESMMIGKEKLLLTLGVPAQHQGRPLSFTDVNILDIAIASSWNGEQVGKHLVKAAEKVGHNPAYVISDNASIMNKGVRCAGMKQQRDISHTLGMYLERTYKNDTEFTNYLKLMSATKAKHNMKEIAYLLPPTQRTIARFINLAAWVKWSDKILQIYHTLKKNEQETFSFIPANASLINELSTVVECVENIESLCKHRGWSKEVASECQNMIRKHLLCGGNSRMIKLGLSILDFMQAEILPTGSKTIAHNNSSDIIESIFGNYKARKSPNKLYGITSHVLFMPIYTKLNSKIRGECFDFKAALEEKRIRQINSWANENLSPNLVQMRTKRLQEAG